MKKIRGLKCVAPYQKSMRESFKTKPLTPDEKRWLVVACKDGEPFGSREHGFRHPKASVRSAKTRIYFARVGALTLNMDWD